MIAAIGIMIGFYIFTRMIELIAHKERGTFTKVMAGITLFVTLICVFDLLVSGTRSMPPMP